MPYMAATLDGVAGGRLVEVKTTSAWSRGFGDDGSEGDVPEHYLVQVHHQMAVTGIHEADLVVLIGGQELRVYPIERHPPLVDLVERRVAEFWSCVVADTPPTWGKMTPGTLAALNPFCAGEAVWSESEAALVAGLVDGLEELRLQAKARDERAEECKAIVLGAMGTAQFGTLPDGRVVKRYLEHKPACSKTVQYKESTRHYFKVLKGKA
jgi:predicted phage-related endonuclease